jgi:hypothetical protein
VLFILSWIPRKSYGSFLVPGRTRPCTWQWTSLSHLVSAAEPAAGWSSAHHIVHKIRSGGRLRNWLALAIAIVYTHTYIQQACLCYAWDLHRGPGAPTSAPYVPGIGGTSCSLWLCINGSYAGNPGTVMGAMRGHCVRPDGVDVRPSTVDSVHGGDYDYGLCHQWTKNYVILMILAYGLLYSLVIQSLSAQPYI